MVTLLLVQGVTAFDFWLNIKSDPKFNNLGFGVESVRVSTAPSPGESEIENRIETQHNNNR